MSEALEEFRERLERWDELCVQLRELYYRYLDLAAFRSEKCYFPGRKCVRSWGREYDLGDLTLMWTYIMNTAPLCNKLIRALAEVEYEIRKKALESLEKYGGVEKRSNPSDMQEITFIRLKQPIHAYLVLLDDKVYTIWREFNSLPKSGQLRAAEVERRVLDVIRRYKHGERVEIEIDEYEVDREYERLWLEVSLPENVSRLLGGRDKAPVALFRNLGWLLSDDDRSKPGHASSNPGQVALRMFDWIAALTWRTSPSRPLIFKTSVYQIDRTKDGVNPLVKIRLISSTAKAILTFYEQFGITLSRPRLVIDRGYAILNAIRRESFKREGHTYVVDNVGTWIAFSSAVATLILGDGYVMPFMFGIIAKPSLETTLEGEAIKIRVLVKVLGGVATGREVRLQGWYMRLLLPAQPVPTFEKTVKLYEALVNYPAVAKVEINGVTYLLTHDGSGKFIIGKAKGAELYKAVKQFGLRMGMNETRFVLTYTQLKELSKYASVQILNEVEKEAVRKVRSVPSFDLETVRKVLEQVAKMARIVPGRRGKYKCVNVVPHDMSKLEEILAMLEAVRIRAAIDRSEGRIKICEQKSVELIYRAMSHFFPSYLASAYM